jgi:hypothetical protein
LIDLRAGMDANGTVTAWDSEFFIPQQTPNAFFVPLIAAALSEISDSDAGRSPPTSVLYSGHICDLDHSAHLAYLRAVIGITANVLKST